MDIFLYILAIAFALLGLVGAVLPVLPGPILSLVGLFFLVCGAGYEGGAAVGSLWIWGAVCAAISVADYLLPSYITKRLGGSRAGVLGATIGLFVGMLGFPPFGVILGPFFGAVMGELIQDKSNVEGAFKIGFGSFVAFAVGTGLKFIYGLYAFSKVVEVLFPKFGNIFNW